MFAGLSSILNINFFSGLDLQFPVSSFTILSGVMDNKSEVGYLGAGMSGRPTRTFMRYLHDLMHEQTEADEGLLRTN